MAVRPMRQPPAAEVLEGQLLIHELETAQPDVVRGARRFVESTGNEDVLEYVIAALEVGSKCLAIAGTTVDVDQVRSCVEDFSSKVALAAEGSVQELLRAVDAVIGKDGGTVALAVQHAIDGLKTDLSKLVAGEDAPVRAAISKSVAVVTDRALGEVQRALTAQSQAIGDVLNSDNPASPLNSLRLELLRAQSDHAGVVQEQLRELRTMIEVSSAVKRTMERSAVKGNDYQSCALEAIDRLAKGTGDVLTETGAIPGLLGHSKKGDAVITLSSIVSGRREIRIVIEAKDMTLGLDAWRRELDAGRKNRAAVAALGVVKGVEHMPGGDRLRVIDPLTYVVAYDPEVDDEDLILAAYQLLRAQAACVTLEGEGEIDVAALRTQLTNGLESLTRLEKIRKAAEQAKNQVNTIVTNATALREDLETCLQRALRLINGATSDRDEAEAS